MKLGIFQEANQEENVDNVIDYPETPMSEDYIAEHLGIFREEGDAYECFQRYSIEEEKPVELLRLERKFGISIIGILDKTRINGYYRCRLLASDSSELQADITPDILDALQTPTHAFDLAQKSTVAVPSSSRDGSVEGKLVIKPTSGGRHGQRLIIYDYNDYIGYILDSDRDGKYRSCACRKRNCKHIKAAQDSVDKKKPNIATRQIQPIQTAMQQWESGEYPVEAPIALAIWKSENKDKLATCILCGRTLTNPISIHRLVGPECFKKITMKGKTFIEGERVTDELLKASEIYSNEKHRNWIIRACLIFEACEPPSEILRWRGEEYFGYKKKPSLYYHDFGGILHVLEIRRRKLNHRIILSSTCETELDARAWEISTEMKVKQGKFLEMGKDLKTWLMENGSRKEISCREICLEFDGKFVTRLRAEIDNGADRAIIEL